jgi:acyl-CoA synthetase (NDP forming)
MNIASFFNPRSILLVGSSKAKETGMMVTPEIFRRVGINLRGFSGKLFVCDTGEKGEFPPCDLAVVTLPPDKILEILPKLKTRCLLILSGGFNSEQRKKLKAFASRYRILGPNSVCGLLNTQNSLNTTFEGEMKMRPGRISVVSQSGGIGVTMLDYMISNSAGISKFAWIGDAVDVNECDLLEYLAADRQTKVILMYLESIRDPRRFMAVARRSVKPVIILKAGISEASKERALTHTDSLSTDAEIYSAAFRQTGAMEVESVRELFNCGQLFERYERRTMNRIAIVSNTGGSSIVASDFCHKLGLELAQLSEDTRRKIAQKYPRIKVLNPIDMAADADGKRYKFVLDIVAKDRNVDAILIINQLKSCLLKPEELELLKRLKTGKIVVDCAPGDEDYKKVKFFLGDTFPIYSAVEDAVFVLKKAKDYGKRF